MDADDKMSWYALGETYYHRDKKGDEEKEKYYGKADAAFKKALKLDPEFHTARVHIIHMLGTLAIYEFLSQSLHFNNISLKWPNDVMVQGKKISGVLQENVYQNQDLIYSVLGIGFNVNLDGIQDIDNEYTSMKIISGKSYKVKNISDDIIPYFYDLYYSSMGVSQIVSLWKNKIDTIGKNVVLEMKDNKRLEGKVIGVNNDGDLLLAKTDKIQLTVKSGLVNKLIVD